MRYIDSGQQSSEARLHYCIACLRHNRLHKLTTEVAKTASLVGVEDLHVKGLVHNRCLSRSFARTPLATTCATGVRMPPSTF